MGNAISSFVNNAGDGISNGFNGVVGFFNDEIITPVTNTFNQLFENNIILVPVILRPPDTITIVNNSHVDSPWSKIMRSVEKTLTFNLKSDSIELNCHE